MFTNTQAFGTAHLSQEPSAPFGGDNGYFPMAWGSPIGGGDATVEAQEYEMDINEDEEEDPVEWTKEADAPLIPQGALTLQGKMLATALT